MNPTKSGDLAEKLVKIKRQRDELLQAAESIKIMIENNKKTEIFTQTNDFEKFIKAINKAKGVDE